MAAVKTRNSIVWGACLLAGLWNPDASAEWRVGKRDLTGNGAQVLTAHTQNESGYELSVYRDGERILARLALPAGLPGFDSAACPTYQIDKRPPDNRSHDGTVCRVDGGIADYLLGEATMSQVRSDLLLAILNGSVLGFRFRLEDGSYRETVISLGGSKRAMIGAIGRNISVLPAQGQP